MPTLRPSKTLGFTALAILLVVAALLWSWYTFKLQPAAETTAELSSLALGLSPIIRAETVDHDQRRRAREMLTVLAPASQAGLELQLAALAFINDDLPGADQHLVAARALAPEEPHLPSFRGAVNLRLSNLALSQEMYLESLALKTEAKLSPVSLTIDQLGLALGLFMLHRPDEARPLAEEAWQVRHRDLGGQAPETLMAANRLATIYIALNEEDQAEKLLKTTYQNATRPSPAREEARLLLAVLYRQSNRTQALAELETDLPAAYGSGEQTYRPEDRSPQPRGEASRLLDTAASDNSPKNGATTSPQETPTHLDHSPNPETKTGLVILSPEADQRPSPDPATPLKATPEAPPVLPEPNPEPVLSPPAPAPLTSEQLSGWEETARALAGKNDHLALELWDKILLKSPLVEEPNQGRDKERHLALAQAAMRSGNYNLATTKFEALLAGIDDKKSNEFMDLSEILADGHAAAGRLRTAKKHWQAAADVVDARLRALSRKKKRSDSTDITRTLTLHLKLADNLLRQDRVPLEAKIELLAALGRLKKREFGNYPEIPEIYLKLGQVTWAMKQTKESARHYGQAVTLAQAGLKKENEVSTQNRLTKVLDQAQREAKDLAAKKPAPPLISASEPKLGGPDHNDDPQLPPSATLETLRLEYTALAALDRLADFFKKLRPILRNTAILHGTNSPEYMRFYTLKLKALEELGLVNELTDELNTWAKYPPGRNEAERALNRGSSLAYAAEVNERAGRPLTAVNLYHQALFALGERTEVAVVERKRSIKEALVRLDTPDQATPSQ